MDNYKPLTTSEISELWVKYGQDTLLIQMFRYFNQVVEDAEIKQIIKEATQLTQQHLEFIKKVYHDEKLPLPQGTTEEEVDITKGRLYTDNFMLQYCLQLGMLGMEAATLGVSMSTRKDIYAFFTKAVQDYNRLHQNALKVCKSKGTLIEAPTIPVPMDTDIVRKKSFLTGWFGERRPLLAMEISLAFRNIVRNSLGAATLTGFSQIAEDKEVLNFILRGIEIANKHVNTLSDVLKSSEVPVPGFSDAFVTDLTGNGLFSDKLMMNHIVNMISLGIAFYGLSVAGNIRRDLASHYIRLSGEIALYADDGAKILIKKGWMEEPPRMVDRGELAKTKGGK